MKTLLLHAASGCPGDPRSHAFKADRRFITVMRRWGKSVGMSWQTPTPPLTRAEARVSSGSAIILFIPKQFYTGG